MSTDDNNQDRGATDNGAGEGETQVESKIELSKKEYDELISLKATTGSLKRDLKDAQKAVEEATKTKDTPSNQTKPDDALLQKMERFSLRQAGVDHQDDIDLAKATAKKWNVDIEEVLADEDFKSKLERQRTVRSNADATSNVRGGGATSNQAKNSPEYWLAKGAPPSAAEVPDRKVRAKIAREFMAKAGTSGKTFYND